MKNIGLVVLALALGAGVVSGCAEKKQPAEKGQEAAVQAEKDVVERPAEAEQEAPLAPAGPEAKAVEKVAATKVVEKKEGATAAVEKAVVKVEEKIAASATAVEKALEKPAADVKNVEAGAAIFKSKCSPCHGPLGKGTPMAPAFAGNDWIKGAANGEIAAVIKNGRDGAAKRYTKFAIGMPPNKNMPDSDINALVDYIRSIN